MRKLGLLLTSMLVLTGFMALSATSSFAAIDPLCDDGKGGIKPQGLYEADIKTEQTASYTPSTSKGQGYACSGVDYDGSDDTSLFFQLDVVQPPNVYIGDTTAKDLQGMFVGRACIGALSSILGYVGRPGALGDPKVPCPPAVSVTIRVDNVTADRQCLEETRGPVIACFRGQSPVGAGYIWVWLDDQCTISCGYVLTIGRFIPAIGRAGLTRIEPFDGSNPYLPPFQCAWGVPSPSGTTCGTGKKGETLVFATGDPTPVDEREFCASLGGYTSDGSGTYSLVATNGFGPTDPVTTCMPWE